MKFVREGKVVEGESSDVKVGDVLLIEEDEFFPADLVLMASSNEKA